ncbi:MAG: hypothetical protein JW827_12690 [Spirochaetes bacterium]|nr:hypothetical protein [Spirochaetota bacterium]
MCESDDTKREGVFGLNSQIFKILSHDLKTPLNAIIGFSRTLDEEVVGTLNKKQKSYIKNIINGSEKLLSLLNDILDLATSLDEPSDAEIDQFSIKNLIERIKTIFNEILLIHNNSVTVNMGKNTDIIYGTEKKIKRLLFELLLYPLSTIPDNSKITLSTKRKNKDSLLIRIDFPCKNPDEIVKSSINRLIKNDVSVLYYFSSWNRLFLIKELARLTGVEIFLDGSTVNLEKSYIFIFPVRYKK